MESATVPADPTHTTPSERVWEINCYLATQTGELIPDPVELERAMVACGAVLQNIGGVMSMAAAREEISPGRVATTRILVRWHSFAPKVQGAAAQAVAQSVPEPVEEPEVAAAANGNGASPE
jgi:predicted component of type VI protein secretion system